MDHCRLHGVGGTYDDDVFASHTKDLCGEKRATGRARRSENSQHPACPAGNKTVEQTLQNRSLLDRVIEANHLAEDRRFVSQPGPTQPSREQLVSKLARMLEVRLRKGTRLIDITVEHTEPTLTALVANSLVQQFLRQNQEYSSSTSDDATLFLSKEAEGLKRKLESSENTLQAYKEQMQAASLEDRQNVVVEKLKELSSKVTEAKSQRIQHETAFKQVVALGTNSDALMVLSVVANDPSVVEIRGNISRKQSEIANLRQRYKWKHPKMIQAESELAEWQGNLRKAILNIPQTIRNIYESAKAAEQALENALHEQESAALELNKQAIRYNVLARDVESDRTLYQSVLSRIKETSVTKNLNPEKIRIIQRAEAPERQIRPQPVKVISIGFAGGLGISLLLILLANVFDSSLKGVDQVEEALGLPVLSAIPRFKSDASQTRRLVVADEAQSAEAEAFRTLRTAISMLGRKEDRRVFLFTSAVPAEGKTFTSLNFALSLARQGLRTLVIDCDLRRPTVEKTLLNTQKRGLGVTDYLTGQRTFESVIHATETENFFYLPAGTDAPNPAELLAKIGIDGLIDEALKQFDRVVIDSAPIHAVSDTLLIVNRVQTTCLVVRARKTPKNSVCRAAQLLRDAGAPLSGRRGLGGYYYYYDTYYDYTYRGSYAEKKVCPA